MKETAKNHFCLLLIIAKLCVVQFVAGSVEKVLDGSNFISFVEEQALKLVIDNNNFAHDSRLVQEEAEQGTIYKHLAAEKHGKTVFRRKSKDDQAKEVIVLTGAEDHLKITKDKRTFVVLRQTPADKTQYFVFYAYVRNALAADNPSAIFEVSGRKYSIEWDIWDHRGSKNLGELFGWTTCTYSSFITCKNVGKLGKMELPNVLDIDPEIADYSVEQEDSGVEASGRSAMVKTKKKTLMSNDLYANNLDYDEIQIEFFLKTIRYTSLAEAILNSVKPSLKKMLKKFLPENTDLQQQVGRVEKLDDVVGEKLKYPKDITSAMIGKSADVFIGGIPEIGALAAGKKMSALDAALQPELFLLGSEILGELLTMTPILDEKIHWSNPNPAIFLQQEISLAISGKNSKGPLTMLEELNGGSKTPFSTLIDVKATNALIENLLPTFINITVPAAPTVQKEPKSKKAEQKKMLGILNALKPKGFRFRRNILGKSNDDLERRLIKMNRGRQRRDATPAPATAQINQLALLKALLEAKAKQNRELEKAKMEDHSEGSPQSPVPAQFTAPVEETGGDTIQHLAIQPAATATQPEDKLAAFKALLAQRAKQNKEASESNHAANPETVIPEVKPNLQILATEPPHLQQQTDKNAVYQKAGETAGTAAKTALQMFAEQMQEAEKKQKENQAAPATDKAKKKKSGGLFGGLVGGFMKQVGKKKNERRRRDTHNYHNSISEGLHMMDVGYSPFLEDKFSNFRTKRADKAVHAVTQTNQDIFSHFGWATQLDLSNYQNEAPLLLNSGTFVGWGPCRKKGKTTLAELVNVKKALEAIDFFTEAMKTNCDPITVGGLVEIYTENYLQLTENKSLSLGSKAIELAAAPKLSLLEKQKLSLSFEMAVFSKTLVKDLKNSANVAKAPIAAYSPLSKNAFVLINFAMDVLESARDQAPAHFIMLTRNMVSTLSTALTRTVSDCIKYKYLPLLLKTSKTFNKKCFNDVFNTFGAIVFYAKEGNKIGSSPESVVSVEFSEFLEVSEDFILKVTETLVGQLND